MQQIFINIVSVLVNTFWSQVVQKEREEKLVQKLKDRLNLYVQGNKVDFIKNAEEEALRLSSAGQMLISPWI